MIDPDATTYPTSIGIEASSFCQLKCPSCPTATRDIEEHIGYGFFRLNEFIRLIENNPQIRHIELSNYGEIFRNPQLPAILEFAFENAIDVTALNGVNLNHATDEALEGLVKYGVRAITVSIDGATPAAYEQYRVYGDFQTVLANIRRLNDWKKHNKAKHPKLIWQFIQFGHNEHEIEQAMAMAEKLDMQFALKVAWDDEFASSNDASELDRGTGANPEQTDADVPDVPDLHNQCQQLWQAPRINWDGKILGCSRNYWGDFGGNAFSDGFVEAVNNSKIHYARQMLKGEAPPRDGIPCTTCKVYLSSMAGKLYAAQNDAAPTDPVAQPHEEQAELEATSLVDEVPVEERDNAPDQSLSAAQPTVFIANAPPPPDTAPVELAEPSKDEMPAEETDIASAQSMPQLQAAAPAEIPTPQPHAAPIDGPPPREETMPVETALPQTTDTPISSSEVEKTAPPDLTIITTCKGRLEHLKQSLPLMLQQDGAEVIVVDFSCPDGTADFVEANYPTVKTIHVPGREDFRQWEARNRGAAQASGRWLAFVDADAILKPQALSHAVGNLQPGSYARFADETNREVCQSHGSPLGRNGLKGFLVVDRQVFNDLGGYDQVLKGYGAIGDVEMDYRLCFFGNQMVPLTTAIIDHVIDHDDEMRLRYADLDLMENYIRGRVYFQIKRAIMGFYKKNLPPQAQQNIYAAATSLAQKLRERPSSTLTYNFQETSTRLEPTQPEITVGLGVQISVRLGEDQTLNG